MAELPRNNLSAPAADGRRREAGDQDAQHTFDERFGDSAKQEQPERDAEQRGHLDRQHERQHRDGDERFAEPERGANERRAKKHRDDEERQRVHTQHDRRELAYSRENRLRGRRWRLTAVRCRSDRRVLQPASK